MGQTIRMQIPWSVTRQHNNNSEGRGSAGWRGGNSLAPIGRIWLNVLVDEDGVSVRVYGDKAGRSRRALISLAYQLHTLRFELAL